MASPFQGCVADLALNSGKDIHCYTATDVYGTKQVPPVSYDQIYYAYKHEEDPNHKLYI